MQLMDARMEGHEGQALSIESEEIDIDRVVWDLEYREEIRHLLVGAN